MTGGHAKEDRQPLAFLMTWHHLNTMGHWLSPDLFPFKAGNGQVGPSLGLSLQKDE